MSKNDAEGHSPAEEVVHMAATLLNRFGAPDVAFRIRNEHVADHLGKCEGCHTHSTSPTWPCILLAIAQRLDHKPTPSAGNT
jgi:hypothetical protein